jgi:hypothetical protein
MFRPMAVAVERSGTLGHRGFNDLSGKLTDDAIEYLSGQISPDGEVYRRPGT